MRVRKIFYGLLVLVAALITAVVVVLVTIDPNEYRDEIREQVKEHTGRDLDIRGDLGLSLFPWIGLEVGELRLSNAPGFGAEPFAEVRGAQIRVQLLPLLKRELRVDVIRLEGLALALQRDSAGHGNWEDLAGGAPAEPTEAAPPEEPATQAKAEGPPLAALAIGGLQIVDSRISLRDQQAGSDLMLDDVNLEVGAIAPGEAFPLSLGFRFSSDSQGVAADLRLEGEVTVAEDLQRVAIDELELGVTAQGAAIPGGQQRVELTSQLRLDLAAQTLSLSPFEGEAAGVPLSGLIEVSALQTAPLASGRLDLARFDARALMGRLALPPLDTADANALKQVAAGLNFSAGADGAELSELSLQLDDSTLSGQLAVTNYAAPGLAFDLQLDEIDVDRYLPPKPEGEQAIEDGASEEAAATDPDAVPVALPVDFLRGLILDGRLRVGKLKANNLRIAELDLPLAAKGGLLRVPGMSAQLYEGALKQSARVDVRGDVPVFTSETDLGGIQSGPLLKDLMGDDLLAGKGDVQAALTTRGDTVGALKRALGGTLALDFSDGAVKGINLGYELRRAEAKFKGEDFTEKDESKATDFASMSVSAVIDKGVVQTDDLDLRSPLLRVGGVGSVDLPKEYVDYKARVLITDTTKGQGGKSKSDLAGLKISLPIRGHFNELSADFTGAVIDAAKADAKARLKEKEDALKADLRKREEEAEARLKEKEEDEKARLKEKEEEAKRELEQKLKDKLKGIFD